MEQTNKKEKINKNTIPENFTIALATVDAIPVVFFGASMVVVSLIFASKLFLFGALLCLIAGICKVVWKYIVVLFKKNIWCLFIQMRILMPIGFGLIILSLFVNSSSVNPSGMWSAIISFPAVLFFIIGLIGMILMVVFAIKLDSSDVKANWIEQATNGIAQISFFIGLLVIYLR